MTKNKPRSPYFLMTIIGLVIFSIGLFLILFDFGWPNSDYYVQPLPFIGLFYVAPGGIFLFVLAIILEIIRVIKERRKQN